MANAMTGASLLARCMVHRKIVVLEKSPGFSLQVRCISPYFVPSATVGMESGFVIMLRCGR